MPRWYTWLVLVVLGSTTLLGTFVRPGALGSVGAELGGVLQVVIALLLLLVVLIVAGWLMWWLVQALIRLGHYLAEVEASFWAGARDAEEPDEPADW